ncbi:hypothetical protein R1T08_17100 [Streptomyces sp. SBC-4]|nr:hypothetical protein [Streptomyces sp. SBC-4]MDV5145878.1 hypothetical protein [Streptomyces sp. SBC-4]
MNAREAAVRVAALLNEVEKAGHQVNTIGSSVTVDDVKVVMGSREGDPWTIEVPPPLAPAREHARKKRPASRYLRSSTGLLHLRSSGPEDDGYSYHHARCGWYTELGREAVPLVVSEDPRVCKRCEVIEP